MKPLGDMHEHLGRVRRMAQATGVDPVAAQSVGALGQQDWAAIVQTCRGCGWADGCDRWLDSAQTASFAPSNCLNRARLAALARALETET